MLLTGFYISKDEDGTVKVVTSLWSNTELSTPCSILKDYPSDVPWTKPTREVFHANGTSCDLSKDDYYDGRGKYYGSDNEDENEGDIELTVPRSKVGQAGFAKFRAQIEDIAYLYDESGGVFMERWDRVCEYLEGIECQPAKLWSGWWPTDEEHVMAMKALGASVLDDNAIGLESVKNIGKAPYNQCPHIFAFVVLIMIRQKPLSSSR